MKARAICLVFLSIVTFLTILPLKSSMAGFRAFLECNNNTRHLTVISQSFSSPVLENKEAPLVAADTQVTPQYLKSKNYSKPIKNQIKLKEFEANKTSLVKLASHPVALPANLSQSNRSEIYLVIDNFKRRNQTAALQRWEKVVGEVAENDSNQTKAADINTMVQFVLRETYRENMEELKFFADKVGYYKEMKKFVGNHVNELRTIRGKMGGRKIVQFREITCLPTRQGYLRNNKLQVPAIQVQMTEAELENSITDWEKQLNWISNDAQLANVDLQTVLQKQQQTMQQLSNISKMLNETANAVVRNIGG